MRRKKVPVRRPVCAAVIAAAGQSARMGELDKLFCDLNGAPLIVHTLMAFETCPDIDEIVVSTAPESIVPIGRLCRDYGLQKVTKIVRGGENRIISVLHGLLEISREAELAAIHDGARPLCTPDVISETVRRAAVLRAVVTAVPLKDTVKQVEGERVTDTLPRDMLVSVQTPQVFDAELITSALQSALDEGLDITDDATAVERMGVTVSLSPGSYENIKVTTPEDIDVACALFARRAREGDRGNYV